MVLKDTEDRVQSIVFYRDCETIKIVWTEALEEAQAAQHIQTQFLHTFMNLFVQLIVTLSLSPSLASVGQWFRLGDADNKYLDKEVTDKRGAIFQHAMPCIEVKL